MTHSDGRQLPIGICRSFNATKLYKGKDGIVKNDKHWESEFEKGLLHSQPF